MNFVLNLLVIFTLALPLAPAARAGEVVPFAQTELAQNVALAREFLGHWGFSALDKLRELALARPAGPAFVQQTLSVILKDETRWKTHFEKRAQLLKLVVEVAKASPSWPGFGGSPIAHQIHKQAHELFDRFPGNAEHRNLAIELFWAMDLWGPDDLPFLTDEILNRRGQWRSHLGTLIRLLPQSRPYFAEYFAQKMQSTSNRYLVNWLIYYETGKMDEDDLIWLFRLLVENEINKLADHGALPVSDRDQDGFDAYQRLKRSVLVELHDKLSVRHEATVHAWETVRAKVSWPGKSFNAHEVLAGQAFLNRLWSGTIFNDCERSLTIVKE